MTDHDPEVAARRPPPRPPAARTYGGRVAQYVFALLTLIGLSLTTVWHHTRAIRAGYRVSELEQEREGLRERARQLELDLMRAERVEELEERCRRLGLPLPGGDPDVYELTR